MKNLPPRGVVELWDNGVESDQAALRPYWTDDGKRHDEQLMPSDYLQVVPGVQLPSRVWRFRFVRSGGPGGQNVNKLNTKATLHVDLAALGEVIGEGAMNRLQRLAGRCMTEKDLVITSDEHRSQIDNRRSCIAKLGMMVSRARRRPRIRKPTRPGRGAVERRLRAKQHRSRIKALRRRAAND